MPDFAVSGCFHSFAIIGFNSEPNGSFYLKNFHTALIRELAALTYFILRFAHISHQASYQFLNVFIKVSSPNQNISTQFGHALLTSSTVLFTSSLCCSLNFLFWL